MSKNSLDASYPALPAARRNAEITGGPAGMACCAALADVQLQLEALRDWVNKRLSVIAVGKYLYRTHEAKIALSISTDRLYRLINDGTLDARKLGSRTYITADSLEAFVAALPSLITPTMMKAEPDRRSGHWPQAAGLPEEQDEAK